MKIKRVSVLITLFVLFLLFLPKISFGAVFTDDFNDGVIEATQK